jgi:sodium-independent sulfate anion transporter 11
LTKTKWLTSAQLLSPWIRRVLVAGGFGTGQPSRPLVKELAPLSGLHDDASALTEYGVISRNSDTGSVEKKRLHDVEAHVIQVEVGEPDTLSPVHSGGMGELGTLVSVETPFIHFDLTAAVRATTGRFDF